MDNSTQVNWSEAGCDLVNCTSNDSQLVGSGSSHDAIKYVVVVLYTVTSVFGLCGNSLTIIVLLQPRRVRTVATCFILNLAIADDLFIVALPFMAYSTYARRWVFGEVACRLMNTFWGVNLYATIFTMTLMSIDRYLAAVHPLKSISYRTCRNAFVVCTVIWVVGFLFVLPLAMYSSIKRNQCQVVHYCCLLARRTW